MATPSLFGTMFQTPEQAQAAKNQRMFEQARLASQGNMENQLGMIGATAGQLAGGGIASLLGAEDPDLKKARDVQLIATNMRKDLTEEQMADPLTVYGELAKRLAAAGYTGDAMQVMQEAEKIGGERKRLGISERAVGVQEEQNAIAKARVAADIEKEKRAAKLTDAQIREIDARIAALGDDKYTFQVIKGELGQPSQIIAINKKNPRDQQVITIGGSAAASNPASGLPGNLTPAQINAELERRRKEGK